MNNNIHKLIQDTEKDKILSKELNIFETFESNNIFLIKEFQRKYEWQKMQIDELLNEINANGSKDYFLGMLIFKKESIKSKEINLSIIDGQQRITTLFLILKNIEKNMERFNLSEENEKIISEIKNSYMTNTENEMPKLKISKIRGEEELKNILIENNFYDSEYRNDTNNEKNPIYTQAFMGIDNWFKDKNLDEILNFYKKIKKIYFSIVIIGQNINEYKVFEDLNSKGVDLKIDDLMRNYFAQKSTAFHNDPQDIVNKYEFLLNKVEIFLKKEKNSHRGFFSDQIGRWFKNFILYKMDSKSSLSDTNDKRMYNLYKKITYNKITNSVEVLDEINLIRDYLDFCKWINIINNNEKYLVNDIEMYPVFFEIYNYALKSNVDLNKLSKLFSLIYITIICSNIKMKEFNKNWLEKIKLTFRKNDQFEKSIKIIMEKMNWNEENISNSIKKKIGEDSVIFQQSKMNRFIPFFYSKMIFNYYKKSINLNENSYNIEHIIPQNPDFSSISSSEEKEKELNLWFVNVNRLKNLSLIESTLNEKLKNKFYKEKKKIYDELDSNIKNELLESTKNIFSHESFGNNELNSRFENIKEFAKKFSSDIWNWNS